MEFELPPNAIGGAEGELPCPLLPCIMDTAGTAQNRTQERAQSCGVEAALWNHARFEDGKGAAATRTLSPV